MDKVRLGRALGYGARHAVKTVAAVAEAATAPSPSRAAAPNTASPNAAGPSPRASEAAPTRPVAPQRVPAAKVARQAGRSVWAPLATYSSALWLRVTGLFFALVALVMGSGAWRTREALRAGASTSAIHHFWVFAAFASLFGYFAVSGFLRADARERRDARR